MKSAISPTIENNQEYWNEIQVKGGKPLYCVSLIAHNDKEHAYVNVWTKDDFLSKEFDQVNNLAIGDSTQGKISGRDAILSRIS